MNHVLPHRLLALSALCLITQVATAQTTVKDAWVRGTVAQQRATGAFMQIQSATGGKLVGVSTAAAGVAEVHEMSMDGGVMKMRALPALDLPAGQPVDLKPGSFHVMLMDLKKPLATGDTVTLTLTIEGKDGKRENVEVKAPVKQLGAMGAMGGGDRHMGH